MRIDEKLNQALVDSVFLLVKEGMVENAIQVASIMDERGESSLLIALSLMFGFGSKETEILMFKYRESLEKRKVGLS